MKILVTGAGGFVGRHLVTTLVRAGYEVVGIDAAVGAIPAGAHAVEGDLGDRAIRRQAIDGGCDRLVHLATIPGGAAEADPEASRRINIDIDQFRQSLSAAPRHGEAQSDTDFREKAL